MKLRIDRSRTALISLAAGAAALTLATTVLARSPRDAPPLTVTVRLSEWKVDLSRGTVPAGRVTFAVTNGGTIPHALEVEGGRLERETALIQPGGRGTLTLDLRPGRYEVYCPVGGDSHKHLGMLTTLTVTAAGQAAAAHGGMGDEMHHAAAASAAPRVIRVTGGGPVIQILPGPFPFADSAAAVIRARPADQRADLAHKQAQGPYSNVVAPASGRISITATDRGVTGDAVSGTAEVATRDGVRWRVVMDRVQTRDIPFNPRFGGVIMGLFYHGASGVHTPLVPTINSTVALWAFAHLYRNGVLVSDSAMVHVMLLSRTRRDGDFHLACWDCSKNPVEELQLQVTPAPGQPPFDAPGGFLFVNWEKSSASGG